MEETSTMQVDVSPNHVFVWFHFLGGLALLACVRSFKRLSNGLQLGLPVARSFDPIIEIFLGFSC